jgi:hypothetical protein
MSDNVYKPGDMLKAVLEAARFKDMTAQEAEEALGPEYEEVQASGEMESGMGTPVAEYAEDGPYHCMDCWYLASQEPRAEPRGRCNEPHMLKDPKVKKDAQGMAIVHKQRGCCRFVDPVKHEPVDKDFVFAKDSKEEEKEHQA